MCLALTDHEQVEMTQAASIFHQATKRSLVVLDELGRGTATCDGTAIAHGSLLHVIKSLGCLTLFVTHYPELSLVARDFPTLAQNAHMYGRARS